MGIHGMISLVLFIAFLVFFAGIVTGAIDGSAVFDLVRDAISQVAGWLSKLIA